MEANCLTHPTYPSPSLSSLFSRLSHSLWTTNASTPNKLLLDFMPWMPQITHVFSLWYTHTHTHSSVYINQNSLWRQRPAVGLTDSHHVVPAIQQAHTELQPVGRVAHVDESQLPVRVLTDGRCPSYQEPADDEQDDGQQTQHSAAGHIGDPLGCAGQEHLQHPVGGEGKPTLRALQKISCHHHRLWHQWRTLHFHIWHQNFVTILNGWRKALAICPKSLLCLRRRIS